jgi:methionyl-tRNA formyltransferase
MSLSIIFAGTPAFAVPTLEALIRSEHRILAVYTQPDKPAGRGQKLTASPVKNLALEHHLPIMQPRTLRDPQAQEELKNLNADIMVVVAYGLILPQVVLDATRLGCINIHPSLLPRWRGAAPIQRTLFAGDQETGVTIMQMDAGLDTGDMLLQKTTAIAAQETSSDLHLRLAKFAVPLLLEVLDQYEQNAVQRIPQDNQLATYAEKITKAEAQLDWTLSAEELSNRVRAFNPWPVAYCYWKDEVIRIWHAEILNITASLPPGTLVAASKEGIDIATAKGVLRISQLQLPGGKILSAAEFLNSRQKEIIPQQSVFS